MHLEREIEMINESSDIVDLRNTILRQTLRISILHTLPLTSHPEVLGSQVSTF